MINANFSEIREHILPRLSNYEWHKDEVSKIPHKTICDLVVTYYINDEPVTADDLDIWSITADELYDIAVGNIKTMGLEIKFMYGIMPIITNRNYTYGAVGVLDHEFMKNMMDKMELYELRLIPSSVHEWIIEPNMFDPLDDETLSCMIKNINNEQVQPNKRLSDHVYKYTLDRGLEVAEK